MGINQQGRYNSPHLQAIADALGITERIKETPTEDAPIYLNGEIVGRCRTRPDFITFSKKTNPGRCEFWRKRLGKRLEEGYFEKGSRISDNKWLIGQEMVTILRFKKGHLQDEVIKEWIADGYK